MRLFFSFQFKAKISKEFGDAPIEQLCLIFAGKILKDHETLAAHNVKVKRPLLTDFFSLLNHVSELKVILINPRGFEGSFNF